jgi:glutathione-regulated potassium-efflux system ancillary protein KefF
MQSMPSTSDVLVISAHPQLEISRVNRALQRAARGVARVEVRDLYALYPDYLIDIAIEQAALARAQLVVWLHPIHWYHMPPLMKLWMDEVLAFGWAYGPQGNALRGKDLWLVASTGGPEDSYQPTSYNRYHFDAFVPPYEQSATLCGMRFLPPMLIHGAHRIGPHELAEHAALLAERLQTYPQWPELENMDACVACEVPTSARPSRDATGVAS